MKKIVLNIAGNSYDAHFGLGFLERVTKSENITIKEVFTKIESDAFFFVPTLIWHSVNYGLYRANKEEIAKDVILDWLDEIGINSTEVATFLEALGKSIQVHIPESKEEGKPKAKK